MNIFDFPNDDSGKHPISAYEKWSIPLDKFAADYEEHKTDLSKSTYHRLRGLLPDALCLYEYIWRDFRDVHNRKEDRRAGSLKIVKKASERRKTFDFPFAKPPLPPSEYRLTKGATYPILAAFRNYSGRKQYRRFELNRTS